MIAGNPENRLPGSCRPFAGPPCTLLNREFKLPENNWVQLVPLGEFPVTAEIENRAQKVVQILDRAAVDEMAAGFKGEVLIDYEHFSHDTSKESRAAGWITAVEARDDGLYAQVRWSNRGRTDIEGGEYRFISPEFGSAVQVQGDRWRPVSLTGAGLTNKPNLKTLQPLSNREGAAGGGSQTTTTMDYKALLTKVLGLPATATDEDIQAAASKTGGKSTADMSKDMAALNRELQELRTTEANRDLEGVQVDDDTKATLREALMANREKGLKLVAAVKGKEAPATTTASFFNRSDRKPPETGKQLDQQAKADEAKAAKISNRAQEISRKENVPFGVAWNRATAEAQ